MWSSTNRRVSKIVKYENNIGIQQSFDVLEAYANMKRGSKRSILNALGKVHDFYKIGDKNFRDIDEAILVSNALVELKSNAGKTTDEFKKIESMRIELIQMCIDYIGNNHEDVKHIDQFVLIFNTLLSEHFVNGNIDLKNQSSLEVPTIFKPNYLLDTL